MTFDPNKPARLENGLPARKLEEKLRGWPDTSLWAVYDEDGTEFPYLVDDQEGCILFGCGEDDPYRGMKLVNPCKKVSVTVYFFKDKDCVDGFTTQIRKTGSPLNYRVYDLFASHEIEVDMPE